MPTGHGIKGRERGTDVDTRRRQLIQAERATVVTSAHFNHQQRLAHCAFHFEIALADDDVRQERHVVSRQRATMQRIAATGISLPPAIEFTGTEEGNMVVGGHHPEADLIDAEICCDIQLAQYFKEVEVEFELLRALECESRGTVRQMDERFHLGLTSTGPVVYFGR